MAPWQKSSGNFCHQGATPGARRLSAGGAGNSTGPPLDQASLSAGEGKLGKQWRDILFEKKGDNDFTINVYIYIYIYIYMICIIYYIYSTIYIHLSICTEVST